MAAKGFIYPHLRLEALENTVKEHEQYFIQEYSSNSTKISELFFNRCEVLIKFINNGGLVHWVYINKNKFRSNIQEFAEKKRSFINNVKEN